MEDAMGVIRNFVGCPYDKGIILGEGLRVKFIDAGHLLGSSSIEVNIQEDGVEKTIVFSGDIGNKNQPLIKDPVYFKKADYVVMESTYGDRSHGERPDYVRLLADIIQETFDRGGKCCDSVLRSGKNPGNAVFHPRNQGKRTGAGA